MTRLKEVRVIIFGVGGVGSWCAEALIRTGLGHLTMVDSDEVAESNCNRQLMATTRTIGRPKVEVLAERLREINPEADITALTQRYTSETADSFRLGDYDYVVDCIDSLRDKADLICRALENPEGKLFCSMGAALRTDPTRVRVTEFWKVKGDALARALRTHFKKQERFPKRKFKCVYSEEAAGRNCFEADGNGSLMQVTAAFGVTLASLVVNDLREQ
jgi:tRNA A37 threonylcarbamoyladenosine dehydratase